MGRGRIKAFAGAVALVIMLAGCTTAQKITRPGGKVEYQIACGSSVGWGVCYSRAEKECPQGYETLSEDWGFNRKELKIACK